MPKEMECPYGPRGCPKIDSLKMEVDMMKKNQNRMMVTLYFIAGIVSVTLGVTIV